MRLNLSSSLHSEIRHNPFPARFLSSVEGKILILKLCRPPQRNQFQFSSLTSMAEQREAVELSAFFAPSFTQVTRRKLDNENEDPLPSFPFIKKKSRNVLLYSIDMVENNFIAAFSAHECLAPQELCPKSLVSHLVLFKNEFTIPFPP